MNRIRRIVVVIGTIALVSASVDHWWTQRHRLRDINGDGRVIVICFGDSISGASISGSYPSRLRTYLGPSVEVINHYKNGETTDQGKQRLPDVLKTTHPDYVVVLEGINDHCENPLITSFNLNVMASTILKAHAVPLIGTVYPPAPSDAATRDCFEDLNKAIERIVKRTNGAIVVHFATAMHGRSDLLSDGVHPTGPGFQVLAKTAYDALTWTIAHPEVAQTVASHAEETH